MGCQQSSSLSPGTLWNERAIHLDRRVLLQSNLPAPAAADSSSCRASLLLVDCYSRNNAVTGVFSHSLKHLPHKVAFMFVTHQLECRVFITDRQSAFASESFVELLTKRNIRLKLSSRDRHHNFNPVAERAIRTLKAMARAALTSEHLSDGFWHYAIAYAVYFKYRLEHSAVDSTPFTLATGKVANTSFVRRFGYVCYSLPVQSKKLNKFQALAQTHIFLGQNPSSFLTAGVYNVKTRRITYPHFTDLTFQEHLTLKDVSPELVHTSDISSQLPSGPFPMDYGSATPPTPATHPPQTPTTPPSSPNTICSPTHRTDCANSKKFTTLRTDPLDDFTRTTTGRMLQMIY